MCGKKILCQTTFAEIFQNDYYKCKLLVFECLYKKNWSNRLISCTQQSVEKQFAKRSSLFHTRIHKTRFCSRRISQYSFTMNLQLNARCLHGKCICEKSSYKGVSEKNSSYRKIRVFSITSLLDLLDRQLFKQTESSEPNVPLFGKIKCRVKEFV